MDVSETATERRAAADPTSDSKDKTEAQHKRIVLLGKTGTGKSSLGGSILGEDVFKSHHTANSGTSKCQKVTRQVDDGSITVIDTPGVFDSRNSDDAFKSEIIDMIIDCSEGLDAFLILFKVEKFTEQENEVVSKIKDYFSEEAFKHAVVVFTHGDQLPDGMKIEEFVSENQYLCDLLEKCGNRCCVVDNKYWKNNQQDEYRNNQVQVAKLLQTVEKMVKTGGRYINEMLREMRRVIKQQVQRIGRSAVDMSPEDIWKQAKRKVSDVLKKLAGLTAGILLGALLGVPCMVAKVILELRKNKTVALHGLPAGAASGVALSAAAVSGAAFDAARASGVTLSPATVSDAAFDAARASGVALSAAAVSGAAFDVAAASCLTLPVAAGVYAAAGAAVGGYMGYQEAEKAKSVNEAVKKTAEALLKPVKQVLERPNITHETERNLDYN